MSIREAALLVLQSGALGTGGDVLVLDMGEPVRIVELAERMIRLSGYDVERDNMFGEQIDVEYIGLRRARNSMRSFCWVRRSLEQGIL